MAEPSPEIERVRTLTDEHVSAIRALVPQLSDVPPPARAHLERVVADGSTYLYVARLEGTIVGMLTLVTFAIPTAARAWIEDVVVDARARNRGVASALVAAALDAAAATGATSVDLTSRASRVEAGRLYRALGFDSRDTTVYRYRVPQRP